MITSTYDVFACIRLDKISKIFKRVSGSWRLSSKTRGRLLSQRRKYKNAHKYSNGNKSRISQNGILSGFDYDAFINAFMTAFMGAFINDIMNAFIDAFMNDFMNAIVKNVR